MLAGLMRALLYLLVLAAPVLAQGKKPVFDVPKPDPEKNAAGEETAEDQELDRTLQRLAGWPNERARRAAERLIVMKERSRPHVEAVLASGDPRVAPLKPGAAYVLGRIGDRSHSLMLLLVAAERAQQRHAATFLDAAWRLDEQAAVAEAFRFFHLAETTLRNEAFRFVLDRVSAANLPQIEDLLDKGKAERPFTREIGLRFLDRLVQTDQVAWADVGPRFYAALGDESPQVASRVMRLLASRNDAENIAALNELITREMSFWRQRSYSALALGLMSQSFRIQPFQPETLATLRGSKGLTHPKEMLSRASAALALAQVALRTNDKDLVRLLDREIPIVLIDAVGAGNRHYRDFGSVMPLAYAMLRRITGQTFGDHAPDWAQWWQDHGRRFRARRELNAVEPADLPEAEFEIWDARSRGGERKRLTVASKERPSFLHGRAYAVAREDMAALVDELRSGGFFTAAEADQTELDADAVLVILRVGDLDRKAQYLPGEQTSVVRDALLARVERLQDEYVWQQWWDPGRQPSWELFFAENRRWFSENRDADARAGRLRELVTGSLEHLVTVEDRVFAMRYLGRLPRGGAALADPHVAAILKAVAAERAANEFVAAAVDLLVPAAGSVAAEGLIDALADMIGPGSQALLVRLCEALPGGEVMRLAADPRWKVRRAAVGALADSGGADAAAALAARLQDAEIMVRVAAAEALARRKDPAVLPALGEMLAAGMPMEVRGTAAYACGLLGTREARDALRGPLFDDPSAEVKVRAIQGIEEGGDAEAVPLLLETLDKVSDRLVRAAATTAIVRLETPELVEKLIERLQLTDALDPERVALVNVLARFRSDRPRAILQSVLNGDDRVSADAAALGLAKRWDPAAVFQLIKMVEVGGPATRTAVRHLQLLTSVGFDMESYQRQAENYGGWARTNGTEGDPRSWFRDALEARGYDVAPLQPFVEADLAEGMPDVSDAAVPVLLRALRDNDWFIRRNASYLLARRIGTKAPEVLDYTMTGEEEEAAIRAYNDWWTALQQEKAAERRG